MKQTLNSAFAVKIAAMIAPLALLSCASTDPAGQDSVATAEPARPALMPCDAATAQRHVGHRASQAMGVAILKDSGARTLRWGPPKSAWTMDYREDRVNVRYDEAMTIVEITCG